MVKTKKILWRGIHALPFLGYFYRDLQNPTNVNQLAKFEPRLCYNEMALENLQRYSTNGLRIRRPDNLVSRAFSLKNGWGVPPIF